MALLITAGLFLRSLVNVSRVELGVRTEQIVTFAVSPQMNGYDNARSAVFFERLHEELAAIPGVTSVTSSMVPLLAGSSWGTDVSVEGFERRPGVDANARLNRIGTGYFATLGIPLVNGRDFTTADTDGAAPVAIVNEAFTRKFGLGQDAVGRMMGQADELDMQIVGVVRDAKYSAVKDEVPPVFFTPYRQTASTGGLFFYVRSSIEPAAILRAVPATVAGLDPNLPVQELKTLTQQVRENVFMDRMIGTLSLSFASLATLLAAIGLYGVLAYTVAQRTREIGIRMALGAGTGSVRLMVLRNVGIMLLIGGALGLIAAMALGRGAASLLYGIEATDPAVMVGAVLVLTLLSLAAGLVPAQRATRVDPVTALRYD
jgi:predicted permease